MSASSNPTGYCCLLDCAVSAQAGPTPTTIGLECPAVNTVTAWSAIVYLRMLRTMLLRICYEGCVYCAGQIQQFMAGNRQHAVDLMRVALYRLAQPPKHVIASNVRTQHFRTYAVSASCSYDPSPAFGRGNFFQTEHFNTHVLFPSMRGKCTRSNCGSSDKLLDP